MFTFITGGKFVGNEPIEKAVCVALESVDTLPFERFIDDGTDVRAPIIDCIVIAGELVGTESR